MSPVSSISKVYIPPHITVDRVDIRKYAVSALAASVRADYVTKFGDPPAQPGGWYHRDDWHRVSYVADALRPGGALLDVGVGAGQFLNMLARSGKFSSLVGIDKTRFKKYTEFEPDISTSAGDIARLPFEDDSFDVVTCMEVLEHVPPDVFVAGLAELRRVCRGQLIMSLPFCEPEPISKTHLRRFEAPDILELFPAASYTLLDRRRMPWMIMEERFDGFSPSALGNRTKTGLSTAGDDHDTTIARLIAEVQIPPEPQGGSPGEPDRAEAAGTRLITSVITGRASPTREIDWHCSSRYLGGDRDELTDIDSRDATPAATPQRPLDPIWKRIITGRSLGWRYRSLRNRLRARSRRLGRAAVRGFRSARALPRWQVLEGVNASARARRRPGQPIAQELRVPVAVRSVAANGAAPALELAPFAIGARTTSDSVVHVDVPASGPLTIASEPPQTYFYNTPDGRRWFAAHVPQMHAPTGFDAAGTAATMRLDELAAGAGMKHRARLIATARRCRAVDCSSASIDAVSAARLIIDLAGAGTPLVATAVPGDIAELLGPDLVAAIEGCAVEGLADPRLRERHSVALRRVVHRQHSVYENLAALAAADGHSVSAAPSVSMIMATNRPDMVMFAIEQMAAQQYPNVEILCGLHGFSLPAASREHLAAVVPQAQLLQVDRDRDLGQVLALLGERASGDLVTKWDDDDWYASEHVGDLVAAMRYSGAGVVGKAAEYVTCPRSISHCGGFPGGPKGSPLRSPVAR